MITKQKHFISVQLFLVFFDLLLLLKSTTGQQIETFQNQGIVDEQLNFEHPNEPIKHNVDFNKLEIIAKEKGPFGTVEVIKDLKNGRLFMRNGNSILGSETIETGNSTIISQHIQFSVVYTRSNMNCFIQIGLGVGSVSKALWKWKSLAHVDVVEINPVVLSLAKKHFLWRNQKGNTYTMDGREFLDQAKELTLDHKYDSILIDVFSDLRNNSIDDDTKLNKIVRMYTKQSLQKAKERLKSDGVLVVSVIGSTENPHNEFPQIVFNTLHSIFSFVRAFFDTSPTSNSSLGTIVFFASEKTIHFSFPENVPKEIRTFVNWEIFFPLKKDKRENNKQVSSQTILEDENINSWVHSIKEIHEMYWKTKLEPEFLGHSKISFQEDISTVLFDSVVSNGKEPQE